MGAQTLCVDSRDGVWSTDYGGDGVGIVSVRCEASTSQVLTEPGIYGNLPCLTCFLCATGVSKAFLAAELCRVQRARFGIAVCPHMHLSAYV